MLAPCSSNLIHALFVYQQEYKLRQNHILGMHWIWRLLQFIEVLFVTFLRLIVFCVSLVEKIKYQVYDASNKNSTSNFSFDKSKTDGSDSDVFYVTSACHLIKFSNLKSALKKVGYNRNIELFLFFPSEGGLLHNATVYEVFPILHRCKCLYSVMNHYMLKLYVKKTKE